MDFVARAEPRPAPLPLTDERRALSRRFYDQAHGKSVGTVATLLPPRGRTTTLMADRPADSTDTVYRAVHEATRVRRVTPAEPYAAHRAYPSPRSVFAAFVVIESATADEVIAPITGRVHDATGPGAEVARFRLRDGRDLAVRVDASRFPPAYGSLRCSLGDLEAGHLVAVLTATLTEADIDFDLRIGDSQAISAAVLRDLLQSVTPRHLSMSDWFDRRSSGWAGATLAESAAPTSNVISAVDDALTSAARTLAVGNDRLLLLRHDLVGMSADERTLTRLGGQTHDLAPALQPPFMAASGYSFAVDLAPWLFRHEGAAITTMNATLGFIAQCGALAAAAHNATIRPVRGFDESEWAAHLHLAPHRTVAYQLWLRPWPDDSTTDAAWTLSGVRA